jgi:hypothetical protein
MLAKMYIKNLLYVDKNHDEVMGIPMENIAAANVLLENNRSSIVVDTIVKLVTKALVYQERATSS